MWHLTRKLTTVAVAGALVLGVGMTAFAAGGPGTRAASKPPVVKKAAVDPAQKSMLAGLRNQMKDLHGAILAERESLKARFAAIRQEIQSLKANPKQNKAQIASAKATVRDLMTARSNIKSSMAQQKAQQAALKSAIQSRDVTTATSIAQQIITLMQSELSQLRSAAAR